MTELFHMMSSNRELFLRSCVVAFFTIWLPCVRTTPLTFQPLKYLNTLTEIKNHQDVVNQIIDLSVSGKAKNQSYDRLATFTDKFGNRISGSTNLENAIDYLLDKLKEDGLENVHGETVKVPHWVRGEESAWLLSPRKYKMAMLGLGSSIATPPAGITAEAIVVSSFDELKRRASEAKGKIVVYNQVWINYSTSVIYRHSGAAEAAKVGAVASLIRSITAFSIDSPHTGMQDYQDGVKKIPTACISVEDAEMLHRMQNRGTKIIIKLEMAAKTSSPAESRNIVAEIVGSKYPEQVVLFSGHIDSWDVGQGAMDDGGGAFVSWQALSLVKQLGLRPKRTMRMVMWTGEEQGWVGAKAYYEAHKVNTSNFDLVMESDEGTFTPLGLNFHGSQSAKQVISGILSLLKRINASQIQDVGTEGDITYFENAGVPGVTLMNANQRYSYFHHSNGDTMTVQDPHQMNLCSAVWASVAYVVADLEDMLPR